MLESSLIVISLVFAIAMLIMSVICERMAEDFTVIGTCLIVVIGGIVGGRIGNGVGGVVGQIIGGGLAGTGTGIGFFLLQSILVFHSENIIESITSTFDFDEETIVPAGIMAGLGVIASLGGIITGLTIVVFVFGAGKVGEILFKYKVPIKPEEHLIMLLLKKKKSENYITYVSLCCSLVGEIILYKTIPYQAISLQWMMILTVSLFFLSYINQRILKYRVDHGLYGTCYSEAKEIVSFILELQKKNSNSNGKPPKLVFTQEELDECLQVNEGKEYAG